MGEVTKNVFVVHNVGRLYTLSGAAVKAGKSLVEDDMGLIHNAALVFNKTKKSKILWAGEEKSLPSAFKMCKKINAQGGTVIPAFIDSHTHLVFAGDRSVDFEKRLQGKSYGKIAAEGGGILTTMGATRRASEKTLLNLAEDRIKSAAAQGVSTIEIKTGYGLDFDSEKRCLDVIAKLKKSSPVNVKSTFLAAHAVPPEFKDRKKDYIREVAFGWLPKLKNKIDFIDMFLDAGYFDVEDGKILFEQAQKLKIPIKIHADELELTGGTETAIKFHALSADHLLKIGSEQVELLANSNVTATLLPTTAFFLNTDYAPARKLLDSGARVALATDFNPGTSPTQDVAFTATLAALKMGMKPHEILAAFTLNAAYALGMEKQLGCLLPGFEPNFLILKSESMTGFFYEFGYRKSDHKVFIKGMFIKS